MTAQIFDISDEAIENLYCKIDDLLSSGDSAETRIEVGKLIVETQLLRYSRCINVIDLLAEKKIDTKPILIECVQAYLLFKQKEKGESMQWQI